MRKALFVIPVFFLSCSSVYYLKDDAAGRKFEDRHIGVKQKLGPHCVRLVLTNRSDKDVEILWDESAYVDMAGKSHRVGHKDLTFDANGGPVNAAAVIRPGKTIRDFMLPIAAIKMDGKTAHEREVRIWGVTKWIAHQIYIIGREFKTEVELGKLIGKTYSIKLTIKTDGGKKSYVLPGKAVSVEEAN